MSHCRSNDGCEWRPAGNSLLSIRRATRVGPGFSISTTAAAVKSFEKLLCSCLPAQRPFLAYPRGQECGSNLLPSVAWADPPPSGQIWERSCVFLVGGVVWWVGLGLLLRDSFVLRPTGPGAARQGGHAAGAAAGSTESLRPETKAQPTPHVPQDADEDHRPSEHQRQG